MTQSATSRHTPSGAERVLDALTGPDRGSKARFRQPHDSETSLKNDAAVHQMRVAFLADLPVRQKGLFIRAFTGKSRKAAMRAMCLQCVGNESKNVAACNAVCCPMWPYREVR
ncbi:MAG: hypothetical protein ABFD92_16615 [Planctomycetaceae bacterium]|nr:hypothetical protein [Planctomycetaceae bacterium]